LNKRSYRPAWNSLRVHSMVPKWLDEGKFGIYTHWGVYSVPACGPNGSWYPYNMYRGGDAAVRVSCAALWRPFKVRL